MSKKIKKKKKTPKQFKTFGGKVYKSTNDAAWEKQQKWLEWEIEKNENKSLRYQSFSAIRDVKPIQPGKQYNYNAYIPKNIQNILSNRLNQIADIKTDASRSGDTKALKNSFLFRKPISLQSSWKHVINSLGRRKHGSYLKGGELKKVLDSIRLGKILILREKSLVPKGYVNEHGLSDYRKVYMDKKDVPTKVLLKALNKLNRTQIALLKYMAFSGSPTVKYLVRYSQYQPAKVGLVDAGDRFKLALFDLPLKDVTNHGENIYLKLGGINKTKIALNQEYVTYDMVKKGCMKIIDKMIENKTLDPMHPNIKEIMAQKIFEATNDTDMLKDLSNDDWVNIGDGILEIYKSIKFW